MTTRRAVITGIGLITPQCDDPDFAWHRAIAGQLTTSYKEALGGHAATVSDEQITSGLSVRNARKIDRFSHLGLVAVQRALADAGLDTASLDVWRTGTIVGNCFGGWAYTDRELRHLYQEGGCSREVSPFQATAWFPAAVQGQISLHLGLKGYSKTVMADRASGLVSIGMGARLIETGKLDCAIAGGSEAIDTDFIYAALKTSSDTLSQDGHYAPFSDGAKGFVPAEGACFLILESEERAARRGRQPYAIVESSALRNEPGFDRAMPATHHALEQAMRAAAGNRDVDCVVADGMASVDADRQEIQAIRHAVGARTPITAPKAAFGQLFGAAGALDCALASLMLKKQAMLPFPLHGDSRQDDTRFIQQLTEATLYRVLINGRGFGGCAASLSLTRFS
ncbi:beta-ketoacyl-[acyl-carrier-protein] synthase family protein [Paludibacterium paludis]|uniref:Beta-ketoacyl synthase n=1 Tax=Paludibacterium paludis TaxID=1225769 RepID=A0A918P087_9NEIS|nr:beta-ketoacyl synthase N-terminal-like domain-containing protein [Paludibacterium paludis]GGY11315.1 beta-ketoacyl synthase [Paludibacterium paludis]